MNVELWIGSARTLDYVLRHGKHSVSNRELSDAWANLIGAIHRAGGERIELGDLPPYLGPGFAGDPADLPPDLGPGTKITPAGPLEPRPDWANLRRAVVLIDRLRKTDPGTVAIGDNLGAYLRDTFDALGISVRHEPSLYVAITTAGMLVELAHNGLGKGLVDERTLEAIAHVAQSFTAALIDYLPPEARP